MQDYRTTSTTRKPFRVSDSCPRCAAPLTILVEQREGFNWIGCSGCRFREPMDYRSVQLLERLLFLQRELTKRDPTAALWEELPTEDAHEPTQDAQRELGL